MKLKSPIALNVVRLFRGVVDFYYWRGIPCARKWPCRRRLPASAKREATWQRLRDMHTWLKAAPNSWKAQWKTTYLPFHRTPVDLQRKTYLWLHSAGFAYAPADVTDVYCLYDEAADETIVWIYYQPYDGFEPNVYFWKYASSVTKPPPFSWTPVVSEITREKYKVPGVVPDVARYRNPAAQALSVDNSCWRLELPGDLTYISVLPFHVDTQ